MPKRKNDIKLEIIVFYYCCYHVGQPGLSRHTKTESEEKLAEANTEDYKEELKIVKEGFSF